MRCRTAICCETGGTVEDSARGQNSINAGMPLFLLVVITLLMLQLRSFSRVGLVLLTAPLGLIGVTLFLLLFRVPFGFVAMLGTIALAGMIMRNSVILVDQIEQDIAAGHDRWHAVIDATVRRFRPIVLTALAAVLAMIPLSRSVLRPDGGGDHGRSDRGDRADAAVPAGAVCGVVQSEARRSARSDLTCTIIPATSAPVIPANAGIQRRCDFVGRVLTRGFFACGFSRSASLSSGFRPLKTRPGYPSASSGQAFLFVRPKKEK